MSDREKAIKVLEELPDDISLEEIAETLYTVLDLKKRLDSIDEDEGITSEELKKEIEKW